MPSTDNIRSFWMSSDMKKLVTVDITCDESENVYSKLQLFYLPYLLKCEGSMNFKETLGFTITKIAFSHNEKLVIIGDH